MRFLLLTFLVFLAVGGLNAQQPFVRHLWLNESAMPEKTAALVQDHNGYIWIGADAGIYRFNGRTFTHIDDSLHKPVTALAVQGDSVFIGYKDGTIGLAHGNVVSAFTLKGVKPTSRITALAIQYGCLWIATEAQGIFAMLNGRCVNFNTGNGLSDDFIYSLRFVGPGRLLATSDQGINVLQFLPDGKVSVSRLLPGNALPDNIARVLSPANDGREIFWIGMEDKGICCIKDGVPLAFTPGWKWGQVNDILALSRSHVWVCTETGYLLDCYLRSDSTYEINPYYYDGKKFNKLLQDISGNIWCATDDGLTMMTANYAGYLRMNEHYALKSLSAMVCDGANILYYAIGKDVFSMPLREPHDVSKVFTASAPVTSLYEDDAGRLWIGTLGGGLWCKCPRRIQPVKGLSGITGGHILNISGIGNELWVSSLNGVEELRINETDLAAPEIIRHHGKHTGAGSDYVYQLFPDSKGHMWMATDGAGITMWDGMSYHTWDSATGFPSKVVYSITEDADGNIWAATLGDGLFSYDGNGWKGVAGNRGLQDKNISTIAANETGQVIVVHTKGIDEWYPQSKEFRHFNRRLGLDIDSQSTTLNCYAKDTSGNVWVPFEHGFISFHNMNGHYEVRPTVHINDVLLFLKPVSKGKIRFGSEENYIAFKYDGINFTNPERLYYRYMLEGYDNTWVSTSDETIPFPRLPAGKYKFRVQTSLSSFFYDAAEANYSFKIDTPLWRRPWAIALMVLLLVAAGYGYQRLRERNLKRLSLLQKERMMFEYEHLKSQVNPHFLFNSLNTLASLIEENPETAVDYTVELSDLYRNMLAYRDMDLIPLAEEWSLLKKYFYVQQSRFNSGLYLEEKIAPELLVGKKIIPLALQLLVENAIKHNVVSKSKPLVIHIEATESTITVRNHIQPKLTKEKGTGLGLPNIRKRYALLTKLPVKYGKKGDQYIVTLPLI